MDPYSAAERPGRATRLTDRDGERDLLDRLVGAVRAGESRVLVVRGDPGVGKTVLLDYLAGRAPGCRVARAAGVQSEMELAFAGLHQLCAPMLDHLDRIPVPQRDALRTALGLAAGPPPDRFLVGLAVLSLLSEVAGGQPLICLIDDEQWLDRASELTLGFVARRLAADPVALVFATRDPGAELAGQPELVVAGLKDDHARALLDSALAGPLDARVRDLIIAETRGNPLALLELPRGLTPAELAGGFGLPAVDQRLPTSPLEIIDAGPSSGRRSRRSTPRLSSTRSPATGLDAAQARCPAGRAALYGYRSVPPPRPDSQANIAPDLCHRWIPQSRSGRLVEPVKTLVPTRVSYWKT